MDAIYDFGINLLLFFQGLGAGLITLMKGFSFLGTEQFFLLVAPAVYWCWDAGLGLRIGMLLMISSEFNGIAKLILHQPRPYWVDGRVIAYGAESSFGIPSGHAQNAVVVWAGLATWLRQRWVWVVACLLIVLIGISRLFLGVHFPSDVLAGWALGSLLLIGLLLLEKPLTDWLKQRSLWEKIVVILVTSLFFIGLGWLARLSVGNWTLPAGWVQAAALATPQAEPIDPLTLNGIISNAGVILGLALGAVLMTRSGGFDAGGPWGLRLARFLVGLVGVLLIWFGLGLLFPDGDTWLALALRYLRYGLVGAWISFLGPSLFQRLKLAGR